MNIFSLIQVLGLDTDEILLMKFRRAFSFALGGKLMEAFNSFSSSKKVCIIEFVII